MEQLIMLINEMAPYLLFGFLVAGLIHAFVPSTLYSRYLANGSFKSVVLATLLGVPLPLCSCGVIPTAMSLRRDGASKGATTAFLIATPQTGVDSIIATYSLMGLPFAIIRPLAALITALLGGQLVNLIEGADGVGNVRLDTECANGKSIPTDSMSLSFWGKLKVALRYAFIDMMQDVGKWLVIGLFVAGVITVFVPDTAFEVFKDNSLASMLLVLCIAIPMYLCATGSIPIAVALMMKGLTPGAGLVLLMAGPACNMASVLVVNKVLGRRTLITYLASIVFGAVVFGMVIDHLLPHHWFLSSLIAKGACCHGSQSWFVIFCSLLLALLLANALIRYFYHTYKTTPLISDAMKMSFIINGMNCNHCRMSAEKAILPVAGVSSASVDLATKVAIVEGTASSEAICRAVEAVGFSCSKA